MPEVNSNLDSSPPGQQEAKAGSAYPRVEIGNVPHAASPVFPDIEKGVLDFWEQNRVFDKSIAQRDGAEEYVFYDGPPFANGLPHYGHLLTGYVKDVVPRYRTMRGYKVERRFGWDCHGLPAELEAEKQLGITEKSQIEEMGLATFNDACRTSVLQYTDEWQSYVTRQARWVDFDNDYKTLDLDFMESVMWAFKTLFDKGLLYQGFRVLPYSWYEQTPLSNQETRLDDAYKNRQDPAVTVGFPLVDAPGELAGAEVLVWTTTPWTLPSNLAAAVHPEVDYVVIKPESEEFASRTFVLAAARASIYEREFGEFTVVSTVKGSELVGLAYQPPFDFFAGHPHAHVVLSADYVTTDSGTGIVHQAPAFGEEDKDTCDAAGIELVIPVGPDGKFTAEVPPYEGQLVFDANSAICKDLRAAGKLIRHETIEHSYPHSWRSGQPLIYMAMPAWFVAVTQFRDRMVELNQEIDWTPEHIRDGQFGKWLEGARDWNISRNRYWGAPLPVWTSDNPEYPRTDVYGSLDELERDFGVRPTNLHRPYIDELVRPNPDDPTGQSMMRRIPDVLDCWFESGSMPFAQVHYPFENKDWFESHNPGDFIVEYNGQTRGWFYTLHVLATALFDRPAFKHVAAHGIVLGDDGLKMSKSKGNYPDVTEVFDRDGSDAMRWFLLSSPILRGGNLIVTERGIREGVRQALLPLWNSYSFFRLYASQEATWRTDSTHVLDRYILARLSRTRREMTERLDATDIAGAADSLRLFVDSLTNWYIRRSRPRFWVGEQASSDARDAFDTLYTVLEVTCRLAAPLLPLMSEAMWTGLTGEESVHLTHWPREDELPSDEDLVSAMENVRSVCSAASSVRKAQSLRVRLPLQTLTVASATAPSLQPFTEIIADEVNVREVVLTADVGAHGRFDVAVNARVAGPRLGKDVQRAIKAVKSGAWEERDGVLIADGLELLAGEYEQKLVAENPDSTAALSDVEGVVVLDLNVTEELEAEGWAKDRVREIQEARRSAEFDVSDRIHMKVSVPQQRSDWFTTHSELIAGEVLASSIEHVSSDELGEGAVDLGDGVHAVLTVVS